MIEPIASLRTELRYEAKRPLKIAFGYLAYPFAIASYFRHALEKLPYVELFTFGPFTNDYIPWNGGMRLPMKYVKQVNLPLPQSMTRPAWNAIKNHIPFKPDLVICCDAGFHLQGDVDVPYAVIATDPHVLNYDEPRKNANWLFNMQRQYMQPGDIHLPYCMSPDHHYAMSNINKEYDGSLVGLHYQQRDQLVRALRSKGHKILYELGLVYDEYREANNKAKIGINWSSLMDINARTFEIMGMAQIPLINRLPHLYELGLIENKHYLGFSTIDEAVRKFEWALENPDFSDAIALSAYLLVNEKHTYEIRVQQILETAGLG